MIQSVDRAVRILKALAGGPGRLGGRELSDRLGLGKGPVHGLLRTLQAHGLVEQHPDSDKYQLGPQLLLLSNRYLDLSELRPAFAALPGAPQRRRPARRPPRLPARHEPPDPRGRLAAAPPRDRSGQGRARLSRPGSAVRPGGNRAREADRADARYGGG